MCVFVALGIQQAMRVPHIVICDLPHLQNFSTLSPKHHDFRKKKVIERKLCFDFLYKLCLKHFSFYEELGEI
jgi:hypothetical protein